MKKCQPALFFYRLTGKLDHFPLSGQLELTRLCGLNCVHCYCKGSEDKARELTTEEWKEILDAIKAEGCLCVTFSGGDPLIRPDFLEIYAYAKAQGFLITVYTNGVSITDKIMDHFVQSPPVAIDITLSGITPETYESVTQVPGSFKKVIEVIERLKANNLVFVLKVSCLKQNKDEIGRIKAFAERIIGKLPRNRYRFKYDPFIFPRYDGDHTPTQYRLSPREIEEMKKQDPDIWKQYEESLECEFPKLKRDKEFMYRCNAWMKQFFVDAHGKFRFCIHWDKFGFNLKTCSFKEGFYNIFPQVLNQKFKTDSQCRDCYLKPVCYYCPARAFLETGNEEGPVPYFCELAKATYEQMKKYENATV